MSDQQWLCFNRDGADVWLRPGDEIGYFLDSDGRGGTVRNLTREREVDAAVRAAATQAWPGWPRPARRFLSPIIDAEESFPVFRRMFAGLVRRKWREQRLRA